MKSLLLLSFIVLTLASVQKSADAQAVATATGPGSYASLGLAVSGFEQDYGERHIGGESAYLDANLYRRIGVEAEIRLLNAHTSEDVKERTNLAGPKISTHVHNLRPYIKLLAGRGTLQFPFHYGSGSYFVVAPGAGVDWRLGQTRLLVRIVDVQYQIWPQFSFGELHPFGVSTGISLEVFNPAGRLLGRHFKESLQGF